MLPVRCSVRENGKDCFNPPEFVISVLEEKQEYMVGVTCQKHRVSHCVCLSVCVSLSLCVSV